MTKISGCAVSIDGIWRPKWTLANGKTYLSPFGWKHKESAERHINIVLENQSPTHPKE